MNDLFFAPLLILSVLAGVILLAWYLAVWVPCCADNISRAYEDERPWLARRWVFVGGPVCWVFAFCALITIGKI